MALTDTEHGRYLTAQNEWAELLGGYTPVVADFETYYDDEYNSEDMSMAQYIRDERFEAFVLGIKNPLTGTSHWKVGMELAQDSFGNSNNLALVSHNCKFEGAILKWRYGIEFGLYIDTVGLSRAVLGSSLPNHKLSTLGKHYGIEKGEGKFKGLRANQFTKEQWDELIEYNATDLDICDKAFQDLIKKFPKSELKMMDWTIRCFINPKLELDTDVLREGHEKEKQEKESIILQSGVDRKVLASNKQFPELLGQRGFEVPTKISPTTKKPIPALGLNDVAFQEFYEEADDDLRVLLDARIAAKSRLLETRSQNLLDVGNPWAFDLNYSGAQQTHRFSGASGFGGNPQNFTRGSFLRKAVKAPKGYKLAVADLSKVELCANAWLSQEPILMGLLSKGQDVYCDFASEYYGRKITREDKKERFFGKCASLGLGYGMGWKKFINTAKLQTGEDISKEQSRKAVNLFRSRYAKIPKVWDKLQQAICAMSVGASGVLPLPVYLPFVGNEIELPSGLKLKYPGLKQDGYTAFGPRYTYTAYRAKRSTPGTIDLYGGKLLENICQALVGELCKIGMLRLMSEGYTVVGMVHDELLVLVNDDEASIHEAELDIYECMTTAVEWWPDIHLDAEIGIGNNWLESKV